MNALLRLEGASVARTRTASASLVAALAMVALFTALASRESAVIAFTGFGRVVTGTALAAVFLLPLLALAATVQAVPAARASGALEWFLSFPTSRGALFGALLAPRLGAVLAPVLLALLGIEVTALAYGAPVPLPTLAHTAAVLIGQGFCFAALGMWVSVGAPSAEQAVLRGILVWLAAAVLLDFALLGAMLRWGLPPHLVFLLSAVNPLQAGRLGVLGGADPQLGVLGPVGTWVVTALGPLATQVYAIGWPFAVGAAALALARLRFVRGDL